MGSHQKSRFWRICRIYFRRFRISVWLLVLMLLGLVIYVNQVGLPDLVKRPLLERLKARGLDLQFSRLRLSWYQGIVAENVHFGPADQELSPQLRAAEVQVRLNWRALAHLQLQIDSLMLRQAHLSWALGDTNQPANELSVANIQTDLRFLPDDQWSLDNFRAQFAGANIQLSGVVTNASAVRDWKIFQGQEPASRTARLWQERLRRIARTLNEIHFSAPPELRINVRGDALDLHTFNVLLSLGAPGAETPWGAVSQGRFAARLFSVDSNGVSRAEVDLHATDAQTPWGAITNCSLNVHLASAEVQSNLVSGVLNFSAGQVETPQARGSNAFFTAQWTHSITNPIPIAGQGKLRCDFVQTTWASARDIHLESNLATASESNDVRIQDPALGWWTNLQPYFLSWACQLSDLKSTKLEADRFSCAGDWRPLHLTITNLEASLFEGQLTAQAELDVATRAARLALTGDCDPHRFAWYLPERAQSVLSQVSWPKAPQLKAQLLLTLPAWTNQQPDWQAEVLPTVQLSGEFDLKRGGAFRQLQISSAHSHFVYSNQCWQLPDLTLVRPEGTFKTDLEANFETRNFYARVSSSIDPMIVRPLLDAPPQRAFDLVTFSHPPILAVEIWGRADEVVRTGLRGQLAASNFTFRGESFTSVQTLFEYTNRYLRVLGPRVEIGNRYLKADGLAVDLDADRVYVTNGFSTVEPMVVARAIGPHVARDIQPYVFGLPPTARVHGIIPLHGEEGADLHFDLAGGPFHWWKFNVPHITGHVHWAGLHLTLTDVQAEFYHGVAAGEASFDFPTNRPTDFRFNLSATNVLLQSLMTDLSTSTNHNLEGRLHGNLTVTQANTESSQSVFGYGEAHLHDGLLWDIPIFGIFSPILNGITPGLGNSRASAAAASFVISNGVIRTSDMEIRSTGMRLEYRGTVNLEGQLNARVDAELLRDMWLVGPLVSTIFWPVTKLFEYRVTGTLGDPKTEPVFILPKIMLLPFHPLKTLKGLKPDDPNNNSNFSPLPP